MGRIVWLGALVMLGGCLARVEMDREIAPTEDWLQVVMEHREAANRSPRNAELRMALEKVETEAAQHFLAEARQFLADGKIDEAIVALRNGLVARPKGETLQRVLSQALARKEARHRVGQARTLTELGRYQEARRELELALDLDRHYDEPEKLLAELEERVERRERSRSILFSQEKITLNFSETDVKDAFQYLADAYSLNVVFDAEVKSSPITLYADKVTLGEALDLVLRASQTQYKQIGRNTLLIAPDTEEKRAQYQDRKLRTFSLNSAKAKDVAEILKANLKLDNAVVNELMNTITIRATDDVLALAERLIVANDQPAGEVVLDVEVLEVDRTKSEQLGLNLGEQITLSYPQYTTSTSLREVLRNGVVTLPTITFNYLKQDVNATILASPSLRVLDSQQAKLHIGERVPLRSSTILDATGQTRTTFEYRDIGIKLEVLPDIQIDGSVAASVRIEVSALGANVGTVDEPAFSILTRHVETAMLLKDGETAMIGGLIQDTDGNVRLRPVGLGEIPFLGRLFTNSSDDKKRTDVVLTITPRVVRPQALPPQGVREFYSGNAERFSAEPLFASLGDNAVVRIGERRRATGASAPALADAATRQDATGTTAGAPRLKFAAPKYEAGKGQQISVVLDAEGLSAVKRLPLEIMFNPALVDFVRAASVAGGNLSVVATPGETAGLVRLEVAGTPGEARGGLVELILEAKSPGISYLMSRPAMLVAGTGESYPLEGAMSRLLVK